MTTEVAPRDLEFLIAKLDPERDYGQLSYEDVVRNVRAGTILLHVNTRGEEYQPLVSDARTGLRIKGSGSPVQRAGYTSETEYNHRWFLERAQEDREKVYQALLRACIGTDKKDGADPRAIKLFLEYVIGSPQRLQGGASTDAISALTELLSVARTVQIDPNTGAEIIDVQP